jgi:hypothetical protein
MCSINSLNYELVKAPEILLSYNVNICSALSQGRSLDMIINDVKNFLAGTYLISLLLLFTILPPPLLLFPIPFYPIIFTLLSIALALFEFIELYD